MNQFLPGLSRRAALPVLLASALLSFGVDASSVADPTAGSAGSTGDPIQAFALTDQDGETVRRDDLRGRVWLMHFFYVGCETPCRRVMDSMLRIQNELFNHPRVDELRLLSVSVDPVMDTPSALADYAEDEAYAYQDRWRFLTATPSEAASLADSAGVELGTFADGKLPGGQSIVLVDRTGTVRGSYRGTSEGDVDRLLADLRRILVDDSGPEPAPVPELPRVAFPPDAENPNWLEPRGRAQLEDAKDLSVFHDFGFEDRVGESGITFLHRIVDDAGRDYKGVHYDHGNGVATADVDGDGHLDLYFTTQLGRNQLWRNRGDGTFEDVTHLSEVDLGDRISVTASFADADNDGDPDLFVTTVMDGNALFRNEGDGRFVDVSERAGVDHVGHSSGAVFFDFDRDGLLDLFVTNIGQYTHEERGRGGYRIGFEDAFSGHLFPERTENSLLYRNLGDLRFAEVSEEMGLADGSWSGDAHPLDFDRDGWIDLYLLDMQGDDELYRNVEGEGFERVSREVFPATPWGSMGIEVFDADGDGRMDLFLTDMHSDMSQKIGPGREKLKSDMQWSEQALGHGGHHALGDEGPSIFGNALFLARDDGYVERSDAFGTENYWPWGVSAGDLNADGWVDAFVTASMNFPWRYGVNSVLLNEEGGGFRDAEFVLGVEPRFAGGRTVTPWFPFDCSGELSHPVHELICRGREDKVLVEGALGSRSSVLLDLEKDGDLDVVTSEFHAPPQVLISDLDEVKDVRWATIDLVGTRSNRDGLGSRVTVTADGRRQVKVLDGKSGYLSQSSQPLYFGLGDAEEIERVEVEWPSGTTQIVEGPIASGSALVLTEPAEGEPAESGD